MGQIILTEEQFNLAGDTLNASEISSKNNTILGGTEGLFNQDFKEGYKYLIYIPDMMKLGADGQPVMKNIKGNFNQPELNMTRIRTLSYKSNGVFNTYRDTTGVLNMDAYGISGTSPLQTAVSLAKSLVYKKMQLDGLYAGRTGDLEKNEYLTLKGNIEKKLPVPTYFTNVIILPIVVFTPASQDGKYTHYLDSSKGLAAQERKVYWFELSRTKYLKFTEALANAKAQNGLLVDDQGAMVDLNAEEKENIYLGGSFFVVDFTNTSGATKDFGGEKGAASKNMVAMAVLESTVQGLTELKPSLNEMAKHMTPLLASQNLQKAALYSDETILQSIQPLLSVMETELAMVDEQITLVQGGNQGGGQLGGLGGVAQGIGQPQAPTQVLENFGQPQVQVQPQVQPQVTVQPQVEPQVQVQPQVPVQPQVQPQAPVQQELVFGAAPQEQTIGGVTPEELFEIPKDLK